MSFTKGKSVISQHKFKDENCEVNENMYDTYIIIFQNVFCGIVLMTNYLFLGPWVLQVEIGTQKIQSSYSK